MILGAALLVLVALALFVGGIVTGATALYWSCVAVSALAAVLLVLARRQVGTAPAREASRDAPAPPIRDVVPKRESEDAGTRSAPQDVVPVKESEPTGATSVTDGTAAHAPAGRTVDGEDDEPGVEEVEVTDLLLVMDLHDEVVVVDEHPRYHLAECPWLRGRTPIPLPLDEARTDGFTPCGICTPDRHLATVERRRRSGRGAS